MPITILPQLSENPAAILGRGDVAICDPFELANGGIALVLVQKDVQLSRQPGEVPTSQTLDLEHDKADLALVFESVAAVDQMAATLAELRDLLLRSGSVAGEAEPTASAGAYLSLERLHRMVRGLIAESSFFDPNAGDVIGTSELRGFLDRLDDEFYGLETPRQRSQRNEARSGRAR